MEEKIYIILFDCLRIGFMVAILVPVVAGGLWVVEWFFNYVESRKYQELYALKIQLERLEKSNDRLECLVKKLVRTKG